MPDTKKPDLLIDVVRNNQNQYAVLWAGERVNVGSRVAVEKQGSSNRYSGELISVTPNDITLAVLKPFPSIPKEDYIRFNLGAISLFMVNKKY